MSLGAAVWRGGIFRFRPACSRRARSMHGTPLAGSLRERHKSRGRPQTGRGNCIRFCRVAFFLFSAARPAGGRKSQPFAAGGLRLPTFLRKVRRRAATKPDRFVTLMALLQSSRKGPLRSRRRRAAGLSCERSEKLRVPFLRTCATGWKERVSGVWRRFTAPIRQDFVGEC